MCAAQRPQKIDTLMEDASRALAATRYFEAERLAEKALELAHQAKDYGRLARILLPLQEARRQRYQQALDVGTVTFVDDHVDELARPAPGCHLVRPPLVGAEARRLRIAALQHEVPAAVLCREPRTQLGLWPIVAIGPGATVRAKLDPPEDPDHPDTTWFAETMEALGDFAIDTLDPALTTLRRLEALLCRLDTIPEHERLHQALAETCREAEREELDAVRAQPAGRSAGADEGEPAVKAGPRRRSRSKADQ